MQKVLIRKILFSELEKWTFTKRESIVNNL